MASGAIRMRKGPLCLHVLVLGVFCIPFVLAWSHHPTRSAAFVASSSVNLAYGRRLSANAGLMQHCDYAQKLKCHASRLEFRQNRIFMAASTSAVPSDPYVVFTRLRMRNNGGLKWEKRWAQRKSNLVEVDGFQFFSMLRRCNDMPNIFDGRGGICKYPQDTPDYMSMTWWQCKDHFESWSKSGAFADSHGKGLFGWASLFVWALQVLKSPPVPMTWDALNQETASADVPHKISSKDRAMAGVAPLPAECFVAMNRFSVKQGTEAALEEWWTGRERAMAEAEGLATSALLRRDTSPKENEEGPGGPFAAHEHLNYSTCSVWRSRDDFLQWFRDSGGPGFNLNSASESIQLEAVASGPLATFWEGLLTQQPADAASATGVQATS